MSFEWSFLPLRQPIKLDDSAFRKNADIEHERLLHLASSSILPRTPDRKPWWEQADREES